MPLSIDDTKNVVKEFCKDYPIAAKLVYRVRNTPEEAYGNSFEGTGTYYGGYIPATNNPNPRFPGGRCDLFAAAFPEPGECKVTLRHEVLGHFGLNTFTSDEKRSLLASIIEAKEVPGLKELWQDVEKIYKSTPLSMKAEEVYARACEAIEPHHTIDKQLAQSIFKETCIDNKRLLQAADLTSIAIMVSDGLKDRSREQKTFPQNEYSQFKVAANLKKIENYEQVLEKSIANASIDTKHKLRQVFMQKTDKMLNDQVQLIITKPAIKKENER